MPIYTHKSYEPQSLLFYKINQACNKENKSQGVRKGKEKQHSEKTKNISDLYTELDFGNIYNEI